MDEREATLWREVVLQRDSIAPRLVLADYLMDRGDVRGELITMQCTSGEAAAERAKKLVYAHWDAWLGPLALVLSPLTSEFRNGMLEVASVGRSSTQPEQYAGLSHRELALVREVRPAYVSSPEYMTFLASAELDPSSLQVDRIAMMHALAASRPRLTITAFEYKPAGRNSGGNFIDAFEALAPVMPNLAEIRFGPAWYACEPMRVLAIALLGWFPRLRRIEIDARLMSYEPSDLARIRAVPQVVLA